MATLKEILQRNTASMIVVMQAFVDGETIFVKRREVKGDKWFPLETPSWDWTNFDYKVQE